MGLTPAGEEGVRRRGVTRPVQGGHKIIRGFRKDPPLPQAGRLQGAEGNGVPGSNLVNDKGLLPGGQRPAWRTENPRCSSQIPDVSPKPLAAGPGSVRWGLGGEGRPGACGFLGHCRGSGRRKSHLRLPPHLLPPLRQEGSAVKHWPGLWGEGRAGPAGTGAALARRL